MKKILRFVGQAVCILLVGAGLLAALFATFCLVAMLIVWVQVGALQPMDRPILVAGVKWLVGSCILVAAAWWLRCKISGRSGDTSFRLVESKSGRLERLVQNFFSIGAFIVLATWLWPRVPGSAIIKVPIVTGWLVVGFLAVHAYIAFHELGHMAAAWLVGFDLRKIQVGVGPVLWSRLFGNGLGAQLRTWPIGGYLLATPRKTEGFRARQSFIVAAGPLVDLIILSAMYQLITRAFGGLVAALGQGASALIAFALFWWLALAAVGGLIPRKVRLDNQDFYTDGHWLLRLLTESSADVTELARSSNWRELLELYQSDCPRRMVPQEPVDRELQTHLASLHDFQEQRAVLKARLLRRATITSSPPA